MLAIGLVRVVIVITHLCSICFRYMGILVKIVCKNYSEMIQLLLADTFAMGNLNGRCKVCTIESLVCKK